jgi:hypothetical protein
MFRCNEEYTQCNLHIPLRQGSYNMIDIQYKWEGKFWTTVTIHTKGQMTSKWSFKNCVWRMTDRQVVRVGRDSWPKGGSCTGNRQDTSCWPKAEQKKIIFEEQVVRLTVKVQWRALEIAVMNRYVSKQAKDTWCFEALQANYYECRYRPIRRV